jgi:hypothetical protein
VPPRRAWEPEAVIATDASPIEVGAPDIGVATPVGEIRNAEGVVVPPTIPRGVSALRQPEMRTAGSVACFVRNLRMSIVHLFDASFFYLKNSKPVLGSLVEI